MLSVVEIKVEKNVVSHSLQEYLIEIDEAGAPRCPHQNHVRESTGVSRNGSKYLRVNNDKMIAQP